MATLSIEGKEVTVGDEFLSLPPDKQNATVEEIARTLRLQAAPAQNADPSIGSAGRATRAQREYIEPVNPLTAAFRGAAQGASLNFGDELSGMAAASGTTARASQANARAIGLPSIPSPIDVGAGALRMGMEKLAPSFFGTTGGDAYDASRAQTRADLSNAQMQQPGATLAGTLVGGLTTPIPASAVATVPKAIGTGVAMGAASGFGGGNGLSDRMQDAATGGVFGGILGGILGRLLQPRAPKPPQSAVAGQDALAAAERQGVDLPRALATDSTLQQRMGQGLRNVPLVGDRIPEAMRQTTQQIGQKVDDVVTGLGSGDRAIAGQRASDAIQGWMTGESSALTRKAYDAVEKAVDPAIKSPLSSTQGAIAQITARRQQGGPSTANSEAVNAIVESATLPGGLSFEGIKQLRSSVGQMMDNKLISTADQGELKLLYGALSNDLKQAASNAGGPRGLALFERANNVNRMVADRREQLQKVVGADGSASAEQVFERLASYAASGKGGDIQRLALAKKTVGADEWNDVASAVIGRMGRDANGDITPDRLVTAYGKLSDSGKNVLFGNSTPHRKAIDDFFAISTRMQDVGRKFGNPSGTGQTVAAAGLGTAGVNAAGSLMAGDIIPAAKLLGGIVGGKALAGYMANPASSASMAKWAQAYEVAVRAPSVATAVAFDRATKNMAATIGDKAGVPDLAGAITRQLTGPRPAPAEDQSRQQP